MAPPLPPSRGPFFLMAPPLPPSPSFIASSKHDDHEEGRMEPSGYARKSYDLNSKIMLASIISLSVVVVLVTLLHIYARWLIRRQARRRAAMNSLGLVARGNHHSQPPPKTGLDPSVIACLPTFVFRQLDTTAQTATTLTASECAVCLSVLEDEEVVRLLPNCKHTFHIECINKWFATHSTCPICRAEAKPADQPEPAGQSAGPPPTAPPILERTGSVVSLCVEGTSSEEAGASSAHKRSGSISRLSSFRRMLSRERSSRRIQPEEDGTEDLERQQ
ncbi:hypothetical protein CDL15_Pgr002862 [Punica granatum]|nr:hypothetical protein CDL15_Pgr002862 [Punica granatum]PKI42749.1 hypothetical protein CRG98_036877 [Punica granatum]